MSLKKAASVLSKIGDKLSDFGPAVMKRAAENVAAEALALVQEGFDESKAPDGTPWAPLKRRFGMPLRDTGRLGNSFTTQVAGKRVLIGTNVAYAEYHQSGTSRMPARPMVPSAGKLPPAWRDGIRAAMQEALTAEAKGLLE